MRFGDLYSTIDRGCGLRSHEFRDMADWLKEKGKLKAAKAIDALAQNLELSEKLFAELKEVIHDAEWWYTGDYAEEQFDETWNVASEKFGW